MTSIVCTTAPTALTRDGTTGIVMLLDLIMSVRSTCMLSGGVWTCACVCVRMDVCACVCVRVRMDVCACVQKCCQLLVLTHNSYHLRECIQCGLTSKSTVRHTCARVCACVCERMSVAHILIYEQDMPKL